MIDILEKLNNKEITIDEAYDIKDELVSNFHNGKLKTHPFDEMCLDKYEQTAIAHAASLLTLAKWRKEGWPKECSKCGNEIDYKKFGWTIKDDKLAHIECKR